MGNSYFNRIGLSFEQVERRDLLSATQVLVTLPLNQSSSVEATGFSIQRTVDIGDFLLSSDANFDVNLNRATSTADRFQLNLRYDSFDRLSTPSTIRTIAFGELEEPPTALSPTKLPIVAESNTPVSSVPQRETPLPEKPAARLPLLLPTVPATRSALGPSTPSSSLFEPRGSETARQQVIPAATLPGTTTFQQSASFDWEAVGPNSPRIHVLEPHVESVVSPRPSDDSRIVDITNTLLSPTSEVARRTVNVAKMGSHPSDDGDQTSRTRHELEMVSRTGKSFRADAEVSAADRSSRPRFGEDSLIHLASVGRATYLDVSMGRVFPHNTFSAARFSTGMPTSTATQVVYLTSVDKHVREHAPTLAGGETENIKGSGESSISAEAISAEAISAEARILPEEDLNQSNVSEHEDSSERATTVVVVMAGLVGGSFVNFEVSRRTSELRISSKSKQRNA